MKRIKLSERLRAKIAIGICAASVGSAYYLLAVTLPQRLDGVRTILPQRVRLQEKRMGIKPLFIPKITITKRGGSYGMVGHAYGGYNPQNNLIGIVNSVDFSNDQLAQITDHELGHAYADRLYELMGKGNFDFNNIPENLHYGAKFIGEGIAEYFERTGTEQGKKWSQALPKSFSLKNLYGDGYLLVKPIIRKYGKKGIEYLITHLPTEDELHDLPSYQDRTLKALSKH